MTTLRAPRILATPFRAVGTAKMLAWGAILTTYWLEFRAIATGYGLRVTSDSPTYLALLRDMALHPFAHVSPFVAVAHIQTSHASPDLQMLAFVWRGISPNPSLVAPTAAYHLLAAWGLVVTALLLHSVFLWTRGLAGSRAGWYSIPVLLTLLGPANVIWAGDLSVHGLLYASYYSQTLGIALLLYALHLLPRVASRRSLGGCVLLVTLLLLVHPFSGCVFILLATVQAGVDAARGRAGWVRTPFVIAAGFVLGSLWPAYSLSAAMVVSGLSGAVLVAAAVATPVLVTACRRVLRWVAMVPEGPPVRLSPIPRAPFFSDRERQIGAAFAWISVPAVLACVGLGIVLLVGGWELWLLSHPTHNPLITTNRLAIYWNTRLVRWPLLLGAGTVGLLGLARLARRGAWLPAFWFVTFLAVSTAGSFGVAVPLWYRLLLFCQLPLAAATAKVLAGLRPGFIRNTVFTAFAVSVAFRWILLLATSAAVTFWGPSWLPEGYDLGGTIPSGGSAVVASDPYTSYYIPAATGHKTLLVSASHVGSAPEQQAADSGYLLLHQLYTGDNWQSATQRMWLEGVRYVVVNQRVILADRTLERFSSDPLPFWRTPSQRMQFRSYVKRLDLLGHVIAQPAGYVVYRLDRDKVEAQVGSVGS